METTSWYCKNSMTISKTKLPGTNVVKLRVRVRVKLRARVSV
jgi:hypothetical protein